MLKDKVALVTGAASGIGRAIAQAYGAAGARVIVSDTDAAGGERTAVLVRESGGDAFFAAADVSVPQDCQRLVDAALARCGRLDIACNNAGIGGDLAPTADYPLDDRPPGPARGSRCARALAQQPCGVVCNGGLLPHRRRVPRSLSHLGQPGPPGESTCV